MTQIKSSLGVKNISNHGRVLEVPDVEDEFIDNNANYQQVSNSRSGDDEFKKLKEKEEYLENRKKQVKGQDKLSSGALERISALIGILQSIREVVINGTSFKLRSLKNHEFREVISLSSQVTTLEAPFELRNQYLARSLVSVSGIDMAAFLGSDDLDVRLLFVENLDSAIANRLYDEYLILIKEVENKYAIKNENEAKEIVENLKK